MKKILINIKSDLSKINDEFLEQLIEHATEDLLISIVGEGCSFLEDIVDEIYTVKERKFYLVSTSHPNETLEEVKSFVESFKGSGKQYAYYEL